MVFSTLSQHPSSKQYLEPTSLLKFWATGGCVFKNDHLHIIKKNSNLPEKFLESFLGITSLFSGVAGGDGLYQLLGIKVCLFK